MPAEHKRQSSSATAPGSDGAADGDEQICLSVGLFRALHRLPSRSHPERASLTCTLIYDDGRSQDYTKPSKWDNSRFGDWRRAFYLPRSSSSDIAATVRIEACDPPVDDTYGTDVIAYCECRLQDILDRHAQDTLIAARCDVPEWQTACTANNTEFVLNCETVSQYHHSDITPAGVAAAVPVAAATPAAPVATATALPVVAATPVVATSIASSPSPSPHNAPTADKDGNLSVSAATLETAHRRARSTAIASALVGAAAGSAIGEGVYRRNTVKPSANDAGDAARAGGLAGAAAGGAAGGAIAPVFTMVARRIGAHQCDQCHRDGLYQYWVCQQCSGYDLCDTCHTNIAKEQQSTSSATMRHAADHTFVFHHNGIESFKLMMIFLLIVWIIMNVIF